MEANPFTRLRSQFHTMEVGSRDRLELGRFDFLFTGYRYRPGTTGPRATGWQAPRQE